MRHLEAVTVAPKFRPNQVVQFWQSSEHANIPDWICYSRVRRVEARIEWKDGVAAVQIFYDLAQSKNNIPESKIVKVVTEESPQALSDG